MRKVRSAVERIDDPSMLAQPRVRTALFGEDRVVREGAAERLDDGVFGFPVSLGHEVDRVGFVTDLDVAQPLQMNAAGCTRGAQSHLLEFIGKRRR